MDNPFSCKEKAMKDINESGIQDCIENQNTSVELHKIKANSTSKCYFKNV